MTALRTWFDGRSLRERRMLLVMVALLALTLIWAGIIRPVGDALSSARERQADAAVRLGETQARVAAVEAIRARRVRPIEGTLADVIRARANDAGFALANLDAQAPDRVRITIQSAKPGALVGWLARLESSGILVGDAIMTDNGDRTVAATLTLQARGR